ncbi:MAG: Gfo/Idh/MocA family protein, partial [Limisphaerales bacterium]
MKKLVIVLLFACLASFQSLAQPIHIAVVGLVHDHAWGFFPRFKGRDDAQLVGIVETNQALIDRYSRRFHFDPGIFYPSLDALFAK